MATNDIQLTGGIRSNLLLLQQISGKLDRTQQRLATGNKINGAIDGPVAYFASKGLNRRADDLATLKDSINQSVSTIRAADTGMTKIETLIEQAKGLITSAYQNLGSDANSVDLRKSLAEQFNTLLRQIDKLAEDSSYQGKNLLLGSGLRLDATSSSKSATNALPGVTAARVTNVTKVDDYVIDVSGDGRIAPNASDVADAERDRGISNLVISGFQSKTAGNLDPVSIRYTGGKGKAKTFTITEGDVAVTKTFTLQQWADAKSTGQVLNFDHQFASGTHINFDIDFDQIDDVADTNGLGTSVVEKLIDLGVNVSNFNGVGQEITRSANNLLGQQKLADGENSWDFDTGTPRLTIDERTILQSSAYSAAIGESYGRASSGIVGTPVISTSGISNDFTYNITASATAGNFNFTTGHFDIYTVTATGPFSTAAISVSADGVVTFSSIADNGQSVDINFLRSGLNGITVASASDATQANATENVTGGAVSAGNVTLTSITGMADNLAHKITINLKTDGSASTFVLDDGYGGKALITGDLNSAQVLSFVISGGVNSGAVVQITIGGTSLRADAEATLHYNAIGAFTAPDELRFDVRAAQTGFTSTLNTIQVTDGTDQNNLTVQLNETNTNQVTVISRNVKTDGQGLAIDFAQNNWLDRADIDNAAAMIDAAKIRLRSTASALNNNLDVITTRLDYTKEFIDVLAEGANKLVQADQNEEGANMLQLQTRQQLGTISLSLANQAQQAILRLF
ncbi:flagellin N-terminal helical domain-containing protein [Dongia rigui]|uniref:Flagellin n=1 Tax=Dongia rigui TaxID=940149 RepID=A0ABU5DT59_9PROT|nr:flagellin [Dongia rigui]MDY0870542.1 flagellin [Dongia rigui]